MSGHKKTSQCDSAREREFNRYFHHTDLAKIPFYKDPYYDPRVDGGAPSPSDDRALLSFAQLGALRLNARRCLITFFDRRRIYVMAEATRTLSLETNTSKHQDDEPWWGARIYPKGSSICEHVAQLPLQFDSPEAGTRLGTAVQREVSTMVIPDLRTHEVFKTRPYVQQKPFIRFYAGAPIRSSAGVGIGAYCVMDEKPRPGGLDKEERDFMLDMAATIMRHLEMTKAKEERRRGNMMVKGLGSFVEGMDSLREWCAPVERVPNGGSSSSSSASTRPEPTASSRLKLPSALPKRLPLGRSPLSFAGERTTVNRKYSEHIDPLAKEPAVTRLPVSSEPSFVDESTEKGCFTVEPLAAPDQVNELQDVILAPNVKSTFQRAAKIIREATELDGSVFFDASVGTFGGLVDDFEGASYEHGSWPSSPWEHSNDNFMSNTFSHHRKSSSTAPTSPRPDIGREPKKCALLGSCLGRKALRKGQTFSMSESFLHGLLQHYPRGAVFSFGDATHFSDFGREATFLDTPPSPSEISFIYDDARALRAIFPQAHSLAICPLWDSHRTRWFACALVWTIDPMRVLSVDTELSYLVAFGNSVMAEVARLDAKLADQAKGDFISSVSHELRSPLHGILGSVELLREMGLGRNGNALVGTVEVCGRTLLDTIEHVLDFAKINTLSATPVTEDMPTPRSTNDKRTSSSSNSPTGLTSTLDLSLLAEEVLETVCAGYGFSRLPSGEASPDITHDSVISAISRDATGVCVITDILHADHWVFETEAGAWRRILLNLIGNSLKYTEKGFIRVRLTTRQIGDAGEPETVTFDPVRFTPDDTESEREAADLAPASSDPRVSSVSEVCLTVTDTGKGMSASYQREKLFHAFAQEDPFSPGTGLGLSITRQLVDSLGGIIEIVSEPGKGTEVKVTCRLRHGKVDVGTRADGDETIDIRSLAQRTTDMSACLVGFEKEQGMTALAQALKLGDPLTSAHSSAAGLKYPLLKASIKRACSQWLGMTIKSVSSRSNKFPSASVYVVWQDSLPTIANLPPNVPVLILCQIASLTRVLKVIEELQTATKVELMTLPCGPRKIASAIEACLTGDEHRQTGRSDGVSQLIDIMQRNSIVDLDQANLKKLGRSRASTPTPPTSPPTTARDQDKINAAVTVEEVQSSDGELLSTPSSTDSNAVLCVDDNPINLNLLKAFMSKARREHEAATNGQEAVDAYKRADGRFEFILMDISMPILDGLAATRQIRAWERDQALKPTTIIALTGLASASAQQEALASGVDLFMTKPVKFSELVKILDPPVQA